MKKFLAILAILAMVSGCALFQTVCHPSSDQQATVATYKAQAQALLTFLQTQIPDPTVQAAIAGVQAALSVYDQVLAGVCIAADVIQTQVNSVNKSKTLAIHKMGFKG